MKQGNVWAALVLILLPDLSRAQETKREPIVTDRPDFTESTQTVPVGMLQLEGGYTFTRSGPDKEHSLGELLLRIAAGARAEVRVGINSFLWTRGSGGNASGIEDASLGFKARLVEKPEGYGLARPSVSVIGATSLPTGARAFRVDDLQPEVKLCLGWDLAPKLGMASNLNWGYPSEDGTRYGQFSGSLSFAYELAERVGGYVEYFGFVPGSNDGPNANYLNGGATYLVTDDYQLDARAGVGLNSASPDYFVGVGLARRW